MNYFNVGAKPENNEFIQLVYIQRQTNELCLIMILLLQGWGKGSVLMFAGFMFCFGKKVENEPIPFLN